MGLGRIVAVSQCPLALVLFVPRRLTIPRFAYVSLRNDDFQADRERLVGQPPDPSRENKFLNHVRCH